VRINIASLIAAAMIWSMPAIAVDQGEIAPKWQAANLQGERNRVVSRGIRGQSDCYYFLGDLVPVLQGVHALFEENP
jgi:hypothetical protein